MIMVDFAALKECFSPNDIEWRIQSSGKKGDNVWARVLAYVTNRAIQERLDEVCGPENWKNEYTKSPDGGVLCGISIRVGDEWVTKYDGAENTQVEAVKGGLSSAMKRAGVQWGIGRYLYELPAGWADINQTGEHSAKTKDGAWFKWSPPQLPVWALPKALKEAHKNALENCETLDALSSVWAGLPKTERALYEPIKNKMKEKLS